MPQPKSKFAITRDRYDAVLLDLDGVITDTAQPLCAVCRVRSNHIARSVCANLRMPGCPDDWVSGSSRKKNPRLIVSETVVFGALSGMRT
jgi:hypothetical protein